MRHMKTEKNKTPAVILLRATVLAVGAVLVTLFVLRGFEPQNRNHLDNPENESAEIDTKKRNSPEDGTAENAEEGSVAWTIIQCAPGITIETRLWDDKEGATDAMVIYDFGTYHPQKVRWDAETETMEMGFFTPETENREAYWEYVNISKTGDLPVFEDELEYFAYFQTIYPEMLEYRACSLAEEGKVFGGAGDLRNINVGNKFYRYFTWGGERYLIENYRSDWKINNYCHLYRTDKMKSAYSFNGSERVGRLDEYGYLTWMDVRRGRYCFHQDIGLGEIFFFDVYPAGADEQEDYGEVDVYIYREGETEPFQKFCAGKSVSEGMFSFDDYNADGYLDLQVYFGNGMGGKYADHYVWSPSREVFVKMSAFEYAGSYWLDSEKRQLFWRSGRVYDYTTELYQWTGETELTLLRSYAHWQEREEEAHHVTVTLYENGSPRVLSEANYAAENATEADDCGFGSKAYELFAEEIVWEGQVNDPSDSGYYTLLFLRTPACDEEGESLQNQYVDKLFVLDSETKLERVLSWNSAAGFERAQLLEDAGVEIIYTDGSRHECTYGEVFGLEAAG